MRLTAGMAVCAVIAFVAALIFVEQHDSYMAVACLGLLVFTVFAAVCALLAARAARGSQRMAWTSLAVGLCFRVLCEAAWSYQALVLNMMLSPPPTWGDVGYFVFLVAVCLAMMLLADGYDNAARVRLVLDGLLIGGALFVVAWVTVLQPVYSTGGRSVLQMSTAAAFPVLDIATITAALLALTRTRASQRMAIVLVLIAMIIGALCDGVYAYLTARGSYGDNPTFGAGWAVSLVVLGFAALLSSRRPSHEDDSSRPVTSVTAAWLPYLPMLAAAVVCVPVLASVPGLLPVGIAGTVGVAIGLCRQLLIARENQRLSDVIADQASRDPLTGLANRQRFSDRLARALRLQERKQLPVTVIVLDLDDFKPVNDAFGHHIGDALLAAMAERLRTCVRDTDSVARLGGDEFAILIDGGLEAAEATARRVAAAFGEPFEVDGHVLNSRPSLGLAVSSPGEPTTAGELVKRADLAMYEAKRRQANSQGSN